MNEEMTNDERRNDEGEAKLSKRYDIRQALRKTMQSKIVVGNACKFEDIVTCTWDIRIIPKGELYGSKGKIVVGDIKTYGNLRVYFCFQKGSIFPAYKTYIG